MAMTLPPDVLQLSTYARQAGTDDPVPVLQAISMIDTDTLRHIGRNVWTESYATFGPTTSYLANEFEMQWDELMGLAVAAVGLIVATVGFLVALYTWWTGVGAVAGLIIAVIGFIVTFAGYILTVWTSVKPRLEALAEVQQRFNEIAPPGRWVDPEEA